MTRITVERSHRITSQAAVCECTLVQRCAQRQPDRTHLLNSEIKVGDPPYGINDFVNAMYKALGPEAAVRYRRPPMGPIVSATHRTPCKN